MDLTNAQHTIACIDALVCSTADKLIKSRTSRLRALVSLRVYDEKRNEQDHGTPAMDEVLFFDYQTTGSVKEQTLAATAKWRHPVGCAKFTTLTHGKYLVGDITFSLENNEFAPQVCLAQTHPIAYDADAISIDDIYDTRSQNCPFLLQLGRNSTGELDTVTLSFKPVDHPELFALFDFAIADEHNKYARWLVKQALPSIRDNENASLKKQESTYFSSSTHEDAEKKRKTSSHSE